jgi:DNA-binding IclR family transcriptional regulator
MYGERGQQVPLHATSQGKVILAFLPPGVGERIIDQLELPRYTPATITSAVDLHETMYDVRREGYALNLEEREVGVRSVAAPVLDAAGNVVASVCVGGPIFRVSEDDLRGRLADLVSSTAEQISAELARRSDPEGRTDDRAAQ